MADAQATKEEPVPSRLPPATSPPPGVASDPEEDDLSDLDDVLDEFANTKLDSKAPAAAPKSEPATAPSSSGPGRPEDTSPAELLLENEDEFAKQLQKEMEQLLGQGDFQKQFEDIMKEMSQEMGGANPLEATTAPVAAPAKDAGKATEEGPGATQAEKETAAKAEKSFQETIKKTMERMQSSSDTATSAAASSSQDDMLAQMLASMESGGFGGEEGGDEDFSKVLMGMMEQLTNRDILYEPMKELDDKFPKWMEGNKDKVPKDDLTRYEEQQTLVREIVGRFERKGYSDSNAGDREYIVERMQKMQAAGSPPPDLVGDMNAAQEALQEMDQGCPTQ
ncbi:Pex19-domain-containing protein [Cucurbitaria berberidis CBS 394.84]|uniref:Pex19-domain-containing protein n=1 Tax=Cucurbitaria berberidis CBS 394.84 TaxID=1168544 RepID=A0A9P4GR34_9PLEO|nr:Pex19-domain-containing protein [Cucurbitaria berberidis CBS 394.84]KAF1849759.1 Pex19-domain-containing protein [Cucurbitaria berberidis CBS 394.84]